MTKSKIILFGFGGLVFLAIAVVAGLARADSLKQRCADFDDTWFMGMSYGFGFCNPPNFKDVDVTTAAAVFGAHLEIGRVGELQADETAADIDAKFSKDIYPGYGLTLGTSKNEGNTSQTFYKVSLGNYATLSTLNRWEDILDYNNNGKSLGQRQNVNIVYRVRQGACYGTLSVRGEGPKASKTYFGILSDKAKEEAEKVTEKMKRIEMCGDLTSASDNSTPPATAPKTPAQLSQPSKEEVEKFVREFPPYVPPEDSSSPTPRSSAPAPSAPETPCTQAELERLQKELADAEAALQTANLNADMLTEKQRRIDAGITDAEGAIRDYQNALSNASASQRKEYQKEISSYQQLLAQLKVERGKTSPKLAQARQAAAQAESEYNRLLAETLKCGAAVEKKSIEEERDRRQAESEKQHQAFIDEMKKKEKAIEDRLADKEFRKAVSDFYARENQGQTPPNVRPPERRGDFENVCHAGEARTDRKVCHYPQLNENAGPMFRTAYGEAALTRAEIQGFQKVFEYLNPLMSNSISLLDAVGTQVLPTMPIASGEFGLAPDILEGIGKLPELLSGGIAEIRIPVRIDEYEIIDTYVCQASGADWRAPWTKTTSSRLVDSQYYEIPFRCGAFKPAPGEEEREFFFELGGLNRCRAMTPDALVRKVGELTPEAIFAAWQEAEVPPNPAGCGNTPPK